MSQSPVAARWRTAAGVASLMLALAACAPMPQRVGASARWIESPNYNERRPNYVVLHHTSNDNAERALRTLTDPAREVSAHYLIARDGTVYQLVDERHRAWHAGRSQWGGDSDLNSSSIGIELDNTGSEPFPDAQIEALLRLLAGIQARYQIPPANFLAHADVAPTRKADPSAYFPWRRLAEHGFGLWCDPPFAPVPERFDPALALAAFGYDTRNLAAAIQAFKLRYVQTEVTPTITPEDAARLNCLLQRRLQSLP